MHTSLCYLDIKDLGQNMEEFIQLLTQKFANNDNSVNPQIATKVAELLSGKPLATQQAIYKELCKTATHIAWNNKKCIGMAIIMLPSKVTTNSVAFQGKETVVTADRPLVADATDAKLYETVGWGAYNLDNTPVGVLNNPAYSPLSPTNNMIKVNISNTVICIFTPLPTSDYLMLTATPDVCFQNSFYSYCVSTWEVSNV